MTDHSDHPAIRAVLQSDEHRRAVEEHPAEDAHEANHPEGGLVRDGRGDPPPEAARFLARRKVSYLMPSYRRPGAVWLPSPNFWPGRLGHDMSAPSWVVLHTMVCCWQSAWGRFQQAGQQASSTYGVCLDGHVIQFCDERDGPWTNGTSSGTGANQDSITIEHEDCGQYDGPRTEALYATSAQLVREICQRYGIPIDRNHVIKHNECNGSSTACPDSLDVDRIVRMAVAGGQEENMDATQAGQLDGLYQGWFVHDKKLDAIAKALGVNLDAIKAMSAPVVDVAALAAALAPHLADVVDETKLAADLGPHLGDDVAQALAQRLAQRSATGGT